jgi:hypothetical protein
MNFGDSVCNDGVREDNKTKATGFAGVAVV